MKLLKPGILVALKSQVSGGVSYTRRDLANSTRETGEAYRAWETECVTQDPDEHERAVKARTIAVGFIRRVCIHTNFGLLCPTSLESELDEAIRNAELLCSQHNAQANHTKVNVYALKGRIASTDEQAMRSLSSELSELMGRMDQGIQKLDPESIRKACNDARALSAMLDEPQAELVKEAVQQARKAAREIVSRVEKKGEEGAKVLEDIQVDQVRQARIAFLDFDSPGKSPPELTQEAPAPQVDLGRFGSLEGFWSEPQAEEAPIRQRPVPELDLSDVSGWE